MDELDEIRRATQSAIKLQAVVNLGKNGWPDYASHLHPSARYYHHYRGELSETGGLVTMRSNIVIPRSFRGDISKIHEGHQGLSKCTERAKHRCGGKAYQLI